MDLTQFFEWLGHQGLALDEASKTQFARYQDRLYEVNEVMNLTRVPKEECWIRHFADSLLFEDVFEPGASVLDLGTGPGLPSWPLACARPDLQLTAVDSSGKMLGFLRSMPLPNLVVVQTRAEELAITEKFDFVTGRALAPLSIQLEISAAPCKVGGRVVPMRTPSDVLRSRELSVLGLKLIEIHSRKLPVQDVERVMPVYEKIASTEPKFPRRWSEIKSRPL